MSWLDSFYWNSVTLIEYLGNISNIGYELTNIIIFGIFQPFFILLFIVLWRIEKSKNKNLLSIKPQKITSKTTECFWRLSRLISVLVIFLAIFIIYKYYYYLMNNSYFNFFKIEITYVLILGVPIMFLIIMISDSYFFSQNTLILYLFLSVITINYQYKLS